MKKSQNLDITSNALKIIAIVTMLFDHFVVGFLPPDLPGLILLRIPGRVVAPIMCYMVAQGFMYTSNVKKYMGRILLFAVLSHFPYTLFFGISPFRFTSVMWPLLLGLACLTVWKLPRLHIVWKILFIGVCCIAAFPADWNYVAVLWIFFFGIFNGDKKKQMISFAIIAVALHAVPLIISEGWSNTCGIAVLLAIPLLMLYKGRRGKKSPLLKWGFYVFYPAHLLVLYLIRLLFLPV